MWHLDITGFISDTQLVCKRLIAELERRKMNLEIEIKMCEARRLDGDVGFEVLEDSCYKNWAKVERELKETRSFYHDIHCTWDFPRKKVRMTLEEYVKMGGDSTKLDVNKMYFLDYDGIPIFRRIAKISEIGDNWYSPDNWWFVYFADSPQKRMHVSPSDLLCEAEVVLTKQHLDLGETFRPKDLDRI